MASAIRPASPARRRIAAASLAVNAAVTVAWLIAFALHRCSFGTVLRIDAVAIAGIVGAGFYLRSLRLRSYRRIP